MFLSACQFQFSADDYSGIDSGVLPFIDMHMMHFVNDRKFDIVWFASF